MARVFIPTQLRKATGQTAEVEISAPTLRGVIGELERRWPSLIGRLRLGDGIGPGLAVSIDGAINARGLLAPISPDSEIHFLPAIGGG